MDLSLDLAQKKYLRAWKAYGIGLGKKNKISSLDTAKDTAKNDIGTGNKVKEVIELTLGDKHCGLRWLWWENTATVKQCMFSSSTKAIPR